MSILTHISRFNCLGSSALFAVIVLVATAAVGGGDEAAQQDPVRTVSESCPDVPAVRFDLPVMKAAPTDAVCFMPVSNGGAR